MGSIIDEMNYRYNNPTIPLSIDKKIVDAFLSRERERNVIEQFALWASMSKENKDNVLVNAINEKTKETEKVK